MSKRDTWNYSIGENGLTKPFGDSSAIGCLKYERANASMCRHSESVAAKSGASCRRVPSATWSGDHLQPFDSRFILLKPPP